jgi:hypothetical protein
VNIFLDDYLPSYAAYRFNCNVDLSFNENSTVLKEREPGEFIHFALNFLNVSMDSCLTHTRD